MSHPAHVYNTLSELLAEVVGTPEDDTDRKYYDRGVRRWTARWNEWRARHPGSPLILKCPICSGKERKIDEKLGKWRVSTKTERKILKEHMNESD